MKKTILKRGLCAAVAVSLMLGTTTGCGKKAEIPLASKDNIFTTENITMPEKFDYISAMDLVGDRMYLIGNISSQEPMKSADTISIDGDNGAVTDGAVTDSAANEVAVGVADNAVNLGIMATVAVTEAVVDAAENNDSQNVETSVAEEAAADENSVVNSDGSDAEMNYITKTKLDICKNDGTLIKSIELASSDSTSTSSISVSKMCIMSDGTVLLLENESSWDESTYESSNKFLIVSYDADGNAVSEKDISSICETKDDNYEYINSMVADDKGNVCLLGNNAVYVLDKDCKLLFKIENNQSSADGTSGSYVTSINKTGDGRIVVIENSYSSDNDTYKSVNKAKTIDFDKKAYGDEYTLTLAANTIFNGSSQYDLYLSTDNKMYGYNLSTGEATTVIDWLKSGFDTTTMDSCSMLSDGRIMCTTYNYTDQQGGGYAYDGNNMLINILTKVDPSTIPDKKVISLYTWYLDYNVKQRIAEYNKTNDKYMIEVTSYGDYADETGDYTAGITKLNNDLIAGNIPDILMLTSQLPVESYISKGMLADLNTYIENDAEIKKEDYLPNILEAYSTDGKLYEISPTFSIMTVAAKTADIGDKTGWTLDDYLALEQANPDKNMFSKNSMSKNDFINTALSLSASQYINFATGQCSFNSDGFKKLLQAANSFPDKINTDDDQNIDYNAQQQEYRKGQTLLSTQYLYQFSNIRELEQGQFGEPVSFIGFPCDDKKGSAIFPGAEFSIMTGGKNPDGAWDFIRYFLLDDFQSKETFGFPIKISAYDALMAKAKEKPFYTDENGKKVEYDNSYWIGDQQINIGVNTDEDNQKMMDFIKSVNTISRVDSSLSQIVTEEAAAYFAGQKTVDEVADIIQNRANIYVNESR